MGSRSGRGVPAWGIPASFLHALLIVGLVSGEYAYAVAATAERGADTQPASAGLSDAELEELVAPIALYPDELLAITLPAATYPLQIVQAARFLDKHAQDPELKPDESWDESIIGLLNYPEVIELLNEDLDWTWKLGEAVANQQDDVTWAIQTFRGRADEAGNLASNDKMTVEKEVEDGQQVIIIESASPEVIYVPQYQPTTVVVYQPAPYPWVWTRRPLYWRPGAVFWTGMFVGAAVGYSMRWGWGRGSSYVNVNRNVNVNVNRPTRPSRPSQPDRPGRPGAGGGDRWRPEKGSGNLAGGRPGQGAGGGRPGGGDRPGVAQRPGTADPPGASRPGAGGQPGASRPGAGDRPGAGQRPAGADRPGAGERPGGDRAGTREARPSGSARPQQGGGRTRETTGRAGAPSTGRDLTSPRPSRDSSMGRYGSGRSTRSHASRGASSRGGGRAGGHARGGGGRGGGRRR